MVYVLIAFLVGATASALVMAARERRRSMRLAVEIDRLEAQAAVLERRDSETGLWNSRHFVDALTQEIERVAHLQPPGRAGAGVGGRAGGGRRRLRADPAALGSSIGGSVRALDVACRVGSAEFGVIMAETDSRSASVAAERVLRAMARVRSPNGVQPQASVGIASCPAHADGFDELVERAGSALRSARRAVRREEARAGTVTVSMAVWDDGDE